MFLLSNKTILRKTLFIIVANLMLNTMASFVILLIAHNARIACSDRHTYIHTDRQTHETTTVTLSAHARQGLITTARVLHIFTVHIVVV